MDLVRTATALFAGNSREFPVRLWEGSVLSPAKPAEKVGTLVLTTPRALYALMPPVTELRVAEAYLDGDLEIEGDAVGLIEAAMRWEGPPARAGLLAGLLQLALRRALRRGDSEGIDARLSGRSHSVDRDRKAVQHHYDVSDDFYRLFLDRQMAYSCAYFAGGARTLEEAQEAKLDLVCRKLSLSRGERLLDVGCGWGALISHAVGRYGASALGITLSENQLAEGRRRLAGLPGATVEAADYRRLPANERFHKIASVGMMEHVGRAHLGEYFRGLFRLLHPGGLLLNHAIADISTDAPALRFTSRRGGGFIEKYIFPDGELLPIATVLRTAERAGFEVRDVESLREHYADTCAAWVSRLEENWAEAERLVGRRRARAYRLYLASSAAQFRVGRISVFQALLAKPAEKGRVRGVPRWRGEWYQPARAAEPVSGPRPTPP
ncbi:MAG TPA: cyclopropane-fatty-acyl-phospholipid synthase family protein [Anaeromyxobacter sp.]|nr:cyclopropane-fatty-acyl-phospholipid synthase family protein [Anaeromyxobacter sp.]